MSVELRMARQAKRSGSGSHESGRPRRHEYVVDSIATVEMQINSSSHVDNRARREAAAFTGQCVIARRREDR
jgi:hypothetical protein